MKQILLLLLSVAASSLSLYAQWVPAGPESSELGNFIVDDGTIYFWNRAHDVQYSTDNGATWIDPPDTVAEDMSLLLQNVAGKRLYAMLKYGGGDLPTAVPIYTEDRGATWRADTLGAPRYGGSGRLADVGTMYAWGRWLYVEWSIQEPFYRIKTLDGPFVPNTYIRANQPMSMVSKGDTLFIVSDAKVHYTIDGGANWITPANEGFSAYFGLRLIVDGSRLYCFALKGPQMPCYLYYSDDNAGSWTEIDITAATGTPNPQSGQYYFPTAYFVKGNLIEIAMEADAGTEVANVWSSTDLGATWSRDAAGLPVWPLQTFAYTNDGYLWTNAMSGVYKRTIERVAGVPKRLYPQQGAAIGSDEALSWGPVDGAVGYQVQIATDPEFATIAMERAELTGTSLTVMGLPSGAYYWRVRGISVVDEPGPWSDVGRFSVATAGVAALDTRTFSVRPNPSHDRFTVRLPEGKYTSLELRDLFGRMVCSERDLTGRASLVVDVAGLMPGRYWLMLKGAAGADVSAIVVE